MSGNKVYNAEYKVLFCCVHSALWYVILDFIQLFFCESAKICLVLDRAVDIKISKGF